MDPEASDVISNVSSLPCGNKENAEPSQYNRRLSRTNVSPQSASEAPKATHPAAQPQTYDAPPLLDEGQTSLKPVHLSGATDFPNPQSSLESEAHLTSPLNFPSQPTSRASANLQTTSEAPPPELLSSVNTFSTTDLSMALQQYPSSPAQQQALQQFPSMRSNPTRSAQSGTSDLLMALQQPISPDQQAFQHFTSMESTPAALRAAAYPGPTDARVFMVTNHFYQVGNFSDFHLARLLCNVY